uniref:Uncharacterized protein n=1 Tax=Panagrolaimus superbus TaxID=310955 RepID=A0A914Z9B5_9BILA
MLIVFHLKLIEAVIRREAVFQSINDLVGNIPLMCRYKFLIFDDNYPELIQVNSDLLDLQMFPFATGLPSCVMYLFHKQRRWLISDLKKEFPKCLDVEFYRQLNNFVNDRPDLVMLESPKHKATFPQLYLVLNDCISLKLCSFNVSLKDLNVADKLHLRMDYINSMKQFIPYRLIPEQFIPERKKAPMFFFNERIKYYSIIFVVIFVFPLILTLLVIFSDSLNFYWPLLCCPTIV